MLLVWVGFAIDRSCGCRGGCRRVARQQGGSSVSSSLCTGCCCHDDQCQPLQACSGATLARLPSCLCCWYLSRVCYLGSLLCIHAMITTKYLWTESSLTCLDPNAMFVLIIFSRSCSCTCDCMITGLLGLISQYLRSCCCCFDNLSGSSCADLSVHDVRLSHCCLALSCLLLFKSGTFEAL